MKTFTISLAAAIAVWVALPLAAAGERTVNGSVLAVSGKFAGTVTVQGGKLTAGGREIKLDDVLYLTTQGQAGGESYTNTMNALRLVSGEYWRVDLAGLSNQSVIVRSPALGERQVELATVQSLEFVPEKVTRAMVQPGTMYRVKGDPLPGSLLWIKERDVTVQSLIGALPLPRSTLVAYVMRARGTAPAVALDELCTVDGSLYHGRLALDGDRIVLNHAVWGEMKMAPGDVRYFSRASARIRWLNALQGKFEPGAALLGQPSAPEVVAYRQGGLASPCMQALRIQPASVVSYSIPAAAGAWVFQATIAPRPSNAGDVQLQLRSDNRDLLQRTLSPSSKPEAVELPLQAGKNLEVIVAYGERLALPAAVDLCDPIVRETK